MFKLSKPKTQVETQTEKLVVAQERQATTKERKNSKNIVFNV
jgi:hypothetical protein